LNSRLIQFLKDQGLKTAIQKVNEKFREFVFHQYINRNDWKKAIELGGELNKLYPENTYYALKLSECYRKINNKVLAIKTIERYLKLNFDLYNIIQKIENEIDNNSSYESIYIPIDGTQNFGAFIHYPISKKGRAYLTKISKKSAWQKEKVFYNNILRSFPKLLEITPSLINYIEMDSSDICFVTMEKINGNIPKINDQIIKEMINVHLLISSIKYKDIVHLVEIPNYIGVIDESYPSVPLNALHSLASMHLESTNLKIINFILNEMYKENYDIRSINLMNYIKRLIIEQKLYKKLNLEKHYALQHGDFFMDNFLIQNSNGKLFIIDWGRMILAPKWNDIVAFFANEKIPFNKIEKYYLNNAYLDSLEKLFFIYNLIIAWFIVFDCDDFMEGYTTFHGAAWNYLINLETGFNEKILENTF
jgi:thiamine kinase-like enzyme